MERETDRIPGMSQIGHGEKITDLNLTFKWGEKTQ